MTHGDLTNCNVSLGDGERPAPGPAVDCRLPNPEVSMSEDLLYRVTTIFAAGLGLLLAGGLSLLLSNKSLGIRLLAAGVVAVPCGLLTALVAPASMAVLAAGTSLMTVGLVSAVGSPRLAILVAACLRVARRPSCQSLVIVTIGAACMAGAIAHLTIAEQASEDEDLQWMLEVTSVPELDPVADATATTDGGQTITLLAVRSPRTAAELASAEGRMCPDAKQQRRLFRESPADEASNCHGWVFTGGKYWLSPDAVESILAGNNYYPVSDPRAGDVVIYRQGGKISHSALVNSARPGRPVMVEGKWGSMGVYLHAIGESCYGQSYTFYRSSRQGHVLAGLDGKPAGPSGVANQHHRALAAE